MFSTAAGGRLLLGFVDALSPAAADSRELTEELPTLTDLIEETVHRYQTSLFVEAFRGIGAAEAADCIQDSAGMFPTSTPQPDFEQNTWIS
jgi:hypothetical protein